MTAPIERTSEPAVPNQTFWKRLGSGLITGAADDDPSGIATYSQGGAQFGFNIGWTVLLTLPLMVGIQMASARIGRVTGKDLTEVLLRICPRWVVITLVALLTAANVINLGADLSAMGEVTANVVHGAASLYVLVFGGASLLLQVFLPYKRYVGILKWLTLSLLSYVAVALALHIDWVSALRSAVVPHIQWTSEYLTTVVAVLGTTISPYLFFWQAAQEVEEIRRVPEDKPLLDAPEQARSRLRRLKIDTYFGMTFSNAIAFCMIAVTATTLHAQGITSIQTTAEAAQALQPIAGAFAHELFAAGVIGTGLLALPVLAGSAGYAIATLLRVRKGLDEPPSHAKAFYGILSAAMLIGVGVALSGWSPMKALYWSAVLNALSSVPIMVAIMIAASRPSVMGRAALSLKWKVLGWAATVVMAAASVAMFAA